MRGPKIFYFCYDHQIPSGGQKEMYRHVDILNSHGFGAYAVHTLEGFRLKWFKNTTKVINWQTFNNLYQGARDFVVLPEDLGKRIFAFSGKKIIFNQNVYYGFCAFKFDKVDKWPYLDNSVKYAMTVSEHNEKYLKAIFPKLALRRVYYGVDHKRFIYRPISKKKKIITILSTKSPIDYTFLYQAVCARTKQDLNKLRSYKWQIIGREDEKKVARLLADSLIFVFLGTHDGCPLLPLEAMLSGALVVSYRSGPQAEYLNDQNSFLIDNDDLLGLAQKIEGIGNKFLSNKTDLIKISQKARETALSYSLEREKESVLQFWKEVLGGKKRS